MATEKYLNVRIKNKIHDWNSWIAQDPVLLRGEPAFVEVSVMQEGEVNSVPSVMMKVGDGTHKFSELGWLYARSSDTYEWARAKDKPTYAASEITGIADYIADYVNDTMGISVDTNDVFRVVKVDDYSFKLQTKGKAEADSAWTDVADSVITIPNDSAAIAELQTKVGEESVGVQVNNAVAPIQTALNEYKTSNDAAIETITGDIEELEGRVEANEDAIETLNGTGEGSVSKAITDAFNDFAAKVSDDGVVNTYKELIDYAAKNGSEFTTLVGKVTTLENEMDEAQADITALETAVGTKAEQADLNTLSGRVTTVEGDMTTAKADISTLKGLVGTDKSVSEQINEAISALKIGDYAKAADLTAAIQKHNEDMAGLATVAKSGLMEDLSIGTGTTIIFDCGDSTNC